MVGGRGGGCDMAGGMVPSVPISVRGMWKVSEPSVLEFCI